MDRRRFLGELTYGRWTVHLEQELLHDPLEVKSVFTPSFFGLYRKEERMSGGTFDGDILISMIRVVPELGGQRCGMVGVMSHEMWSNPAKWVHLFQLLKDLAREGDAQIAEAVEEHIANAIRMSKEMGK